MLGRLPLGLIQSESSKLLRTEMKVRDVMQIYYCYIPVVTSCHTQSYRSLHNDEGFFAATSEMKRLCTEMCYLSTFHRISISSPQMWSSVACGG